MLAPRVRAAWAEAGREGERRMAALVHYCLDPGAESDSRAHLGDYYGFLGEWADAIADGALRSADAIRDTIRGFVDPGFTELHLDPTVASLSRLTASPTSCCEHGPQPVAQAQGNHCAAAVAWARCSVNRRRTSVMASCRGKMSRVTSWSSWSALTGCQ